MVQEIIETLAPPEKSRSKGWTGNQQTVTKMSGSKYYTPHSPFFPVKAPPLDQNASSLRISQGKGAMITAKTLDTWESRARFLTTISLHANLFSGAAFTLLEEQNFDPLAIQSLLRASARTARHTMVLSSRLH